MKKFGLIKDDLIARAKERGEDYKAFKNCNGRAQLLAKISEDFVDLYRSKVITLAWLRENYNEEELNKQRIYTEGKVNITNEDGSAYVIDDCECATTAPHLYAFDHAKVRATCRSSVYAYDQAHITAVMRSRVSARGRCHVFLGDFAHARISDEVTIEACDQTRLVMVGQGEARLSGNCSAIVSNSQAHIYAKGFATIHHTGVADLNISENAVAVNSITHQVLLGKDLTYKSE